MAINVPIVSTFDPRGVDRADRRLNRFGDDVRGGLSRIADVARIATAAVAGIAAGAVVAAGKAIQAASDIGEATSKVTVIFGDASSAVFAFAEDAATAFGLSRQAVLDAAGVFGTFGKAAGLTGSDLATFTTDFVALASDLASFNNTTPEEAITAIGAALRGESEPIRRYGVLLDDARLRARALELGIYDGVGSLTAQQKVLAAQAEIFSQTADAQGDFARTSDGLANRTRVLRAQLSNVVVEIGEKLLPAALAISGFISDNVIPVIENLSDTFSREGFGGVVRLVVDWITKTGVPKIREAVGKWGGALVDWIRPRIGPAIRQLGTWIADFANWVTTDGYSLVARKFDEWGTALVEWVEAGKLDELLQKLAGFLEDVGEWVLTTGIPRFAAFAKSMYVMFTDKAQEIAPEVLAALGRFVWRLIVWSQTDGRKYAAMAGIAVAKAFASAWWSATSEAFADAAVAAKRIANAIIRVINRYVIPALNVALDAVFPGLGKFFNIAPLAEFSVPSGENMGGQVGIPKMAAGGIVTAPTLALIGEAGPEAVVPLDRYDTGGGQTVVNVYGALDPVGVARQIRRLLLDDAAREGRRALI